MNRLKSADVIEEIQKLSRYAEILGSPDEFFHHMNGHRTELSLVLSAFSLAQNAEIIIKALEKQEPKKVIAPLSMGSKGICPVCSAAQMMKRNYCYHCGQALRWD